MFALLFGCGGATSAAESTAAAPAAAEEGPSIVVTEEMGHPHVGDEAPDFELTDQEGNAVRLAELRGSVVLLTFAASWCPFSTAEQPHLAQLAQEYADRGVRVVVVNIEETDEGFQRYLERVEMPLPVLRDAEGQSLASYIPPNAQPNIVRDRWKVLVSANLLIDADGVIRFYTLADTLNFDAELIHLRRVLDQLIAEGSEA